MSTTAWVCVALTALFLIASVLAVWWIFWRIMAAGQAAAMTIGFGRGGSPRPPPCVVDPETPGETP